MLKLINSQAHVNCLIGRLIYMDHFWKRSIEGVDLQSLLIGCDSELFGRLPDLLFPPINSRNLGWKLTFTKRAYSR